nr:MAG TPA: hypothetical protein [Bacteriophage sp.]
MAKRTPLACAYVVTYMKVTTKEGQNIQRHC